jgi:hypothetical protein
MTETDETVIVTLRPAPARRGIALAMLYGLGALLVYLAISNPPASAAWLVFLLATGVGALVLGERVRRATAHAIELTETELCDTAGRRLCRVDEIERVDRGMFAFKPSNGFLLRLSAPGPFHWSPGLWWRIGRRIGVGGVTRAAQGKLVADILTVKLAQR